ncbi:MAG: GDP-mannose 4,6-dehydratase [Pirellulales bacterium]|nr:GDP-mannose 4,6-dehydratase [Pirellulales bacterium]
MKQPYLVTGCAGFIASRVTGLLLEAGHRVVGVDNLNDAYDPRLKHWRLGRLKSHTAFRFRQMDISDRTSVEQLFEEDGPFGGVVNLAARAGVRTSVEDPWVYYRANCEGTLNLLDACRGYGVRKFLLASTSSLYGSHNPVPYREDADTNCPLSPYAASKKAAETLAFTYHYLHGLDVSVLRYFTVYGPAGRPDMSVFRFIRRIAEGEPIVVFGDGSQERDFSYVDDIARGTVAALGDVGYEVINLGGDRPVRLSAVIETISSLVGQPVKIDHRPAHPADVPATWADVSKARKLLGWTPEVSIEEGLRRSVQWYRENREMVLPLELGDR